MSVAKETWAVEEVGWDTERWEPGCRGSQKMLSALPRWSLQSSCGTVILTLCRQNFLTGSYQCDSGLAGGLMALESLRCLTEGTSRNSVASRSLSLSESVSSLRVCASSGSGTAPFDLFCLGSSMESGRRQEGFGWSCGFFLIFLLPSVYLRPCC